MGDLLVLCYHAVSATWPAALSVTPDAFERQMGELARRGYEGRRFSEAISDPPDGRAVVVTFDDGYRSVLEIAKPILDRHGFPGTLYVPSAWPESPLPMSWVGIDVWLGTEHESELRSLRWEELRQLADSGWEIGSHTCSHPHLTELADAELRSELVDSRAQIEAQLGRQCTSIAYPYGDVDERVEQATQAAGYLGGVSIPRVLHEPRPLRWPRAPVFHRDTDRRFRAKISPALRRARRSPLAQRLDVARVALSERLRATPAGK